MGKLTIEQNLKAAIIASSNTKPTRAVLKAKAIMESKGKVSPAVIMVERKHVKPVFEAVQKGSLCYIKESEGDNTTLYVPASQTTEEVIEKLKAAPEEEIGKVVAENLIEVEKDTTDEFNSGDTIDTLLGTFSVIETEGDQVYLLDQNNEVITMSVADLKELEPVESIAKSEATQAGDIATPMGNLTPPYKAIFKTKTPEGDIKEEQITAENEEDFNKACSKIEQEPNFVEWVDFIGVENESDLFGELLADQDDVTDEVDKLKNEGHYLPGRKYRSDMGVFKVKKVSNGRVTITLDGKDIELEVSDLELVHPKVL